METPHLDSVREVVVPGKGRASVATEQLTIDRAKSAEHIGRDIETLAGPDYTLSDEAIRRYAYTRVYRNTLDYFTQGSKPSTSRFTKTPWARSSPATAPPARRSSA
jgi:hypothetical protein